MVQCLDKNNPMIERVREKMEERKLDALFLTNKTNIFYLTGFRGSNGFVLLTKKHLVLFTDARYLEKAKKQCESCRIVDVAPGLMNVIHTVLAKHKVHAFGVEGHDISWQLFSQLDSLNGFRIEDFGRLVEEIRMEKTAEELRALRQSQKLNEQTLRLLLDEIRFGMTEAQVAWKLRMIAHDLGADDMSFPPIVAFGADSSIPHHESSNKKKLKRGDMILIDMGLVRNNFASDMTRTFFTKVPTKQQREIYETVLAAQEAGITAISVGVKSGEVDKAAREVINRAGFKDKFGHATGHGIGMDVHELPHLSRSSQMTLGPGMMITVEPGIYLPGKFGVRIEDMIEITAKGKHNITRFPKAISEMILKLK